MADCTTLVTEDITLNCDDINAAIGVEKDLYIINWDDFDRTATLAASNFITTADAENEGGITSIFLNSTATVATNVFTFEGTDYSVQPNVTSEVKEDGNSWYIHSILFTSYNKESKARNTIEDLGNARVVAVAVDRSTGYHELFGADQGLKLSGVERAYVGTQTSNFYQVTIASPDIAVVRESTLGILSLGGIVVSV